MKYRFMDYDGEVFTLDVDDKMIGSDANHIWHYLNLVVHRHYFKHYRWSII